MPGTLSLVVHADAGMKPSSKWFLADLGHVGLNNLLAAYEDKSAKAVCTFAYSPGPGHEPLLFQGITDGKIVPARGPVSFGKCKQALGVHVCNRAGNRHVLT
jgi:hypothetical protein